MYSSSLLVLALAVFGASAQTLISSGLNGCGVGLGGISGISGISGVTGVTSVTGLSGCNSGIAASTPVIENVPLRLPSIIHPATVQDSCNCIKTIVRPTLRKEVYTIPSVQRFVQTTSTPIVETIPYVTGSSADLPAVGGISSGVETGLIGNGLVSGGLMSGVTGNIFSGVNSGVTGGLISGINSGCGLTNVVSGLNSGFGCNY